MSPQERKTFIFDKLFERIRVVTEPEDYKTDLKPEELFDVYEKTDGLIKLKDLISISSNITDDYQNFKEMLKQIEAIKAALSEYSTHLAKNSMIGNIDLNAVKSNVFDKQARWFEKKHKNLLIVSSPSYFI